MIITPPVEAAAGARFKIPEWKWEEAKKRFPKLLPKVNQKRLRRMEYALVGMIKARKKWWFKNGKTAGFSALMTKLRQRVAQWSAGDLHQSLEGPVHLQDQEDRP